MNNRGRVLARPNIVTRNNKRATFSAIDQIPYNTVANLQTTTSSADNTRFANVGVTLSVTPHVNDDGTISMDLFTDISSFTGFTPQNQPIVFSRNANTTVTVENGKTFILGGVRREYSVKSIKKMPGLGDIPFLSYFFKTWSRSSLTTEVVMFITPKLVDPGYVEVSHDALNSVIEKYHNFDEFIKKEEDRRKKSNKEYKAKLKAEKEEKKRQDKLKKKRDRDQS